LTPVLNLVFLGPTTSSPHSAASSAAVVALMPSPTTRMISLVAIVPGIGNRPRRVDRFYSKHPHVPSVSDPR